MIYIVRKHNEAARGYLKDVTLGAFSSFKKVLEGIKSDLIDSGDDYEAMNINPDEADCFVHEPSGLVSTSVRYGIGNNPFFKYYEIRRMTLDGE